MTQQAQVSIIVRTMGHEKLARALASLDRQSWRNLQVVLVVASADPDFQPPATRRPLTVVRPGEPLLRPDAANAGLDAATGAWIGLLDEDDWLDDGHVAALMRAAESVRGFDLVYGDVRVHEAEGPVVHRHGYWKQTLPDAPPVWINTALFSRRLLEAGCRFDPAFHLLEDWDFFVQCAEHTDFLHFPVTSANYDPQAGNAGAGGGSKRDDQRIEPYRVMLTGKWGSTYVAVANVAHAALVRAGELIAGQRWGEAEQVLAEGLGIDPGNPLLLNRLAHCLLQRGEGRSALLALRRACDSDPAAFRLLADCLVLECRHGIVRLARDRLPALAALAVSEDDQARYEQVQRLVSAAA